MVNILRFTGLGRRESAAGGLLSQDALFAHDTVNAANTASAGALSAAMSVPANDGPAMSARNWARRDWTNQELADLYRVEALLIQANICIETTRGLSDEGDPWFVFCHADGEVFVHLARIDGAYVLDGPGLDSVLWGDSFTVLIDRFASAVAARAPTGNIVQFRPGKNNSVVRLHPAVMLAALVWSLYLASDHLVSAAQAGEMDAGDSQSTLFPSLAGAAHEPADMPAAVDAPKAADELNRLVMREGEADLSRNNSGNDGAGPYWSMTSSATGIAAGLTAIAVSFGLYDAKFAERAHEAARTETTEVSATAATAALAPVVQQDSIPTEKGVAESQDAVAANEAPRVQAASVVLHLDANALAPHIDLDAEATIQEMQTASAGKASPPLLNEKIIGASEPVSSHPETTAKVGADEVQNLQSLVTMATQHLGELSTYRLADISVDATFDVATLSKQALQLVLEDLGKIPVGGVDPANNLSLAGVPFQDQPYDSAAMAFVTQFVQKSSIEMIKSYNMVILVDTSAVDEPTDHASSMRWVIDGHTVVYTIGHAQDFDMYLLV